MKLRILDDSIRLRLDRSEVDTLAGGQAVIGATHFPGGHVFTYCLRGGGVADAALADGTLTVTLPQNDISSWHSDESSVSMHAALAHAEGTLNVLVEKDFECLEPRQGESQANRFRNPKAG